MILQSTLADFPVSAGLAFVVAHPFLTIIGIYAAIKLLVVLYRISPLHPLSKVPGPILAGATWWFRTYYEIWPHPGEMTNELHRLHEKYGPVVRIAPNEVHFSSTSAFLHIYSNASKVVKDLAHYKCLNADDSSICIRDPQLARERREIILPFFSRRNVLAMQYVIEDKLNFFTYRLRSIHNTDPKHVIDMCWATKSFTNDVIMEFCFARSFHCLLAPGFRHPMIVGAERALIGSWIFKHFPLIRYILMDAIPDYVVCWMMPEASKGIILLKQVLGTQVDEFIKDPEGMATGVGHEIIYHRLLGLGLNGRKYENTEERPKIGRKGLYDEALALMFGGTDTVGNTLSAGTVYILTTPGVLDRLMEELKSVWPGNPWEGIPEDGEEYRQGSGKLPVGWETLEKLPYLGGVIRESLRMSSGVVSPLQRLAPAQGVIIDGWELPAGTGVSAAHPFVHNNPEIFPEPHEFRPERWIGPSAGALEKYLVAFSKGPRQCLGMNLAWCELYLTFGTLYRRFEFELINTTREDLLYKDYNLPLWNGRINIRVKPRLE